MAYCWGETAVGDGSAARRQPSPVQMPGGVRFTDVQVGRDHACARSTDGRVYCWGTNGSGQTGHDTSLSVVLPRLVTVIDSVVSLALAADASCAVTARGAVFCWGRNSRGELASGDTLPRSTPRQVVGLPLIRSVHAGEQHFCAIGDEGLWCWGRNDAGQLGLESSGDLRVPSRVNTAGVAVYRQLSGGTRHTCAVTSTGAVDCWGANAEGQLGTGDTRDARSPQRITALGDLRIAGISLSGNTSCALSEAGELLCWGSDAQGQLGNGAAPASLLPTRIARPRP
jgi:alpha-tubulin suppressor-like RCC1 family protein